jgi:ribosomal protein S11
MAKAKKKDIKINSGVLHVLTSENNTLITLTTEKGDKLLGG